MVRTNDRPRYYAALFAPGALRADLLAIYGFAAEIARVPDQVKEPRLGEIRLKWWSDSLVEAIGEGGGETPSVRTAAAAITRLALPIAPFVALVEARSGDLYSDPPPTLSDLEGKTGETESVLFQITALALGATGSETAEAAGHAGVAYGLARRLSAFGPKRARGRMILPADLLERNSVTLHEAFAEPAPEGLHAAVMELAADARRHLAMARRHIADLPPDVRVAFLPLAVVGPILDRIERSGAALGERGGGISDLQSLVRIGWSRLRG